MSEHEGGSVWNRETARHLGRRMRFEFSRTITPTTADLMAMVEEKQTVHVDYREVCERLKQRLREALHCPAQHPVIPMELRVTMAAKRTALCVFPNLDGAPTRYVPVRAYFCPVCQEVYRQREIDEAMQPEEVAADA